MKQETKQRIAEYKAALPGLKERVVAVALLLTMSVIMMASASYAWLTISKNPEATGMTTNVTANGNLEIALVNPDGTLPDESKVGDSSAAAGQTLLNSNITWGNLINLSDTSYGLSNIILRPALLSSSNNLLNQPLRGVDYGDDGRAELHYNDDFQFVNWVLAQNDVPAHFEYLSTPQYGVRAIATVEYTYINNDYYQYTLLMKQATGLQETVKTVYNSDKLVGNSEYIDALAGLIGVFMTDKLNDSDTNVSSYVDDIYKMVKALEEIVEDFGDALVALANVQVYNYYGSAEYSKHTYTKDTLFNSTASQLAANGVVLDSLDDYLTLKSSLNTLIYGTDAEKDCIKDFYDIVSNDSSAEVLMSELQPYVNTMVHINSCKITLDDGTEYTVGNIGMSAATNLLGKDVDAKITKGLLKDFEQLSGCKMYATDVEVQATYMFTVKMKAKSIVTTAASPFTFDNDVETTAEVAANNKGDYTAVAQDTYGMAIDFWVRTNVDDSFLILEGNVLTTSEYVPVTGVDASGNVVDLYTVTIDTTVENEEGGTETVSTDVTVYASTDDDGNAVWRNADTHTIVDVAGSTPTAQVEEVKTVIGYEGENRVWDDNQFLSTSNTTQGNGSCYIFYAENPEQQLQCLNLLSNMRVAFIDANESSDTYGRMVGLARLNTDNAYEESGKVTIPLELMNDGSAYLTTNGGELAITKLDKNVATRLTAVIYLDGREMSNADVLAAEEIHGQLNLQFGSTEDLTAVSDEDLELATRSVSAVASKISGNFPETNQQITFSYDNDDNLTVHVKVAVDGEQPNNMAAFFMRKVNATQGSIQEAFPLEQGDDGYWYGSYTFSAPGEYVLRTVRLDGVDYSLPSNNYPSVLIEGFGISSVQVYYDGQRISGTTTVMTGNQAVSTTMTLTMASSNKLPSSVKLQFVNEDGATVTSTMSYNATTQSWTGSAKFTTSGTYTLKYVIMDGEYSELDRNYQVAMEMYMGITVEVTDGGEKYRNTTWDGESYSVPVSVEIKDNTGEEIKYLTGVKLYYAKGTSFVDGMYPDITWNSSEDCYTGHLLINGPGVYTFDSVRFGSSTLKNTSNVPPIYTCMSPNPPSFYDAEPMEDLEYELYVDGNTVTMGVRIEEAEGATVTAVLTNSEEPNKTYEVTATSSGKTTIGDKEVSTFYFPVPNADKTGTQAGDWTIIALKLANVYGEAEYEGAEQPFYDAENPMVWDTTKEEFADYDMHVKIVDYIVTISGEDQTISTDASGNALKFMDSATVTDGVTITITDHNGDPLNTEYITMPEVTLTAGYVTGSSETYGGYTSAAEANLTDFEWKMTVGSDGMTYTVPNFTLSYAGRYICKVLSFTLATKDGNASVSISQNSLDSNANNGVQMPEFILQTAVPTVTITGTNPSGSVTAYVKTKTSSKYGITYISGMQTTSYTAGKNDTGTVANVCYIAKYHSTLRYVEITTQPTVTITLTGIGNANSATLSFGDGARIYESQGGSTKTQYTWTSDKGCTRYIGTFENSVGNDTRTIAGTITATELVFTYNNQTYTFDVPDITINNPY